MRAGGSLAWPPVLNWTGRACFLATAIGFSGEAADGDMHCGLAMACGARAKSQNGNRRRNQGSKSARGQDGEGIKVAAIDAMHRCIAGIPDPATPPSAEPPLHASTLSHFAICPLRVATKYGPLSLGVTPGADGAPLSRSPCSDTNMPGPKTVGNNFFVPSMIAKALS